MALEIIKAREAFIEEILALYFTVYGENYPLAFAKNKTLACELIHSDQCLWLLTVDSDKNQIVGSLIFHLDFAWRIGKLEGVVVHPNMRGCNIASHMIRDGLTQIFQHEDAIDSIYTTTRTVSLGPQKMCLKCGFIPIGIMPNSRKLVEYETLTLMAIYRDGVLKRRKKVEISQMVAPLQQVLNDTLKIDNPIATYAQTSNIKAEQALEFEFINAPKFVKNRFLWTTNREPNDYFYPFHIPNLLITHADSGIEFFAYVCDADKYCTLISSSHSSAELGLNLGRLVHQLHDRGVAYIETIIDMEATASIDTLIESGFLPSAIYPAMYKAQDGYHDFLLLSRCLEPLNFKGMTIARSLKPYVDQYIAIWKKTFMESFEVGND